MTSPLVSVIVPTFNRAELLPRALDSIVNQRMTDWEIVLVDDGSTDGTPRVVDRYAGRLKDRLVYLHQGNRGSSAARNLGIDVARGRFVTFLDSDDEFLPGKLERQLALFTARPDLGLVYCDYTCVDLNGAGQGGIFDRGESAARRVGHRVVAPGLCVCTDDLFDHLIGTYFIATIAGMVRRDVLGDTIRFPEAHAYAEEWLFYLRVARVARAGFVDEPLCVHHYTAGSLARTDKQRNIRRYAGLLREIDAAFSDLTRSQRRAVRRNLARALRQLGYDAVRAGRPAAAVRPLAESFLLERRWRTAWEVLRQAGAMRIPVWSGRAAQGL